MVKASKENEIELCLSSPEVDLWRLREYALTNGGFLNNSFRKRAWPKLLGIDRTDKESVSPNLYQFNPNQIDIPSHAEREQVDRDVTRTSWHLLTLTQRNDWKIYNSKLLDDFVEDRQATLSNFIKIILQKAYGKLKYYQGFHDIAAVFLSILSSESDSSNYSIPDQNKNLSLTISKNNNNIDLGLPTALLLKISFSHLRDFMQSDFSNTSTAIYIVIFPMILYFDPSLHSHLEESGVEPFFTLSWILTWFSHDIHDNETVARLFDAFLASHPLFPLYLSVAMILHPYNRHELLCTECDFAALHMALQKLPRKSCPLSWNKNKKEDDFVVISDHDDGHVDGHVDGHDAGHDNDDANIKSPKQNIKIKRSPPPVPLQSLIEKAISFMRQLPPRKILPLAKNYREGKLRRYTKLASKINLLKNPPSWALMASTPSDWVLKEQKHAALTDNNNTIVKKNVKTHGPQRRINKLIQKENQQQQDDSRHSELISSDYVNALGFSKYDHNAIVASGMGPDSFWDRQRKKKLLIFSGVIIVILSAGWIWKQPSDFNKLWKISDWTIFRRNTIIGNPTDSCNDPKETGLNSEFTITGSFNDGQCVVQRQKQKQNWLQKTYHAAKIILSSDAEVVIL